MECRDELMNHELEMTWKAAVVAVPAEIRNDGLPNEIRKRYQPSH
jgi:hypothetical protein